MDKFVTGFANVSKADELDNLAPYFDDKISSTAVKAEYRLWCAKISSIDQSTGVLKLLDYCNGNYFHGTYQNTSNYLSHSASDNS
ncbi:unnamed protein product [Acanthoscelides obtectus]|uniref:Uncharacterized protein n=1 Tax=Acanthoscelides obtectus TaxID=200917 RepID=A0A9P0JIG2_ACAOB|nr:unnamed protein product [Acanthoscelides obtectus]CAK1661517.1 hypothetical protein AOBTE_LOCUS22660 [Acanthoscelides obtectus]